MESSPPEIVRPEILEIVRLQDQVGSTQIPNGMTRAERKEFIRDLLMKQLEQSRRLNKGE